MNQMKARGQGGRGLAIGGIITGVIGLLLGGILLAIGAAALSFLNSPEGQAFLTAIPLTLTPGP
jgi:hypothetical protein